MTDLYSRLLRWHEENTGAEVRLLGAGDIRRGHLTTSGATSVAPIRLVEYHPRRKHSREYHPIFDRYLSEGYPRLEVKVNRRYEPLLPHLEAMSDG